MPNSTVYDVQVKYSLDDRASRQLESLGASASRAEKHVGGLKEGLQTLAEVFLVKEGLAKAKEWFVDANSEMEQLKINLAAVSSYNLSIPFAKAADQTDRLIGGWQQFSKQTTLTTKQFVEFGAMVEGAVLSSGGGMKQLDEIVKRGAVVSNVVAAGHAGGLQYAATELREALMGNLRKTQQLNMMLLGPAMEKEGKSLETWNTLTTSERMKIYLKAINDPAWNSAIDKQRDSFLGVTSTLRDNFEILARETGEKFFKNVSASVKELNKFIDKHPKEIAEFTSKVSDGLVKAFDFLRKSFAFIIEHKDAIIQIGQVWAMGKIAGAFGGANGAMGMLGGSATGQGSQGLKGFLSNLGVGGASTWGGSTAQFAGQQSNAIATNGINLAGMRVGMLVGAGLDQMTGNLGRTNTALMSFEGALAALPGPLGAVGAVALALHSALKYLAEVVDEQHKKRVDATGDFESLRRELLIVKGRDHTDPLAAVYRAKELGLFSKSGDLDLVKARASFEGIAASSEDAQLSLKSVPNMVKSLAAYVETLSPEQLAKILGKGDKPTDVDAGKKKDPSRVNVTIHKIEVPASDPDRFVHELVRKFDRFAKNPTQAERSLRGGF